MTLFFTIGHSTRSSEDFAALLQESSIRVLVDVRSIPWSRTNPQFNQDRFPRTLAEYQIGYDHIAALGGRKGKSPDAPSSLNGYWRIAAFRNYADYALTPAFAKGLSRLRELGTRQRSAVMCAEAVWWRCHRRIITDYLLAAGDEVFHIMGPGQAEPATLTPGALIQPDGRILYPAPDGELLLA